MTDTNKTEQEPRSGLSDLTVKLERDLQVELDSRGMFVARLENMQANGHAWLTIAAVLALINDCDMLAQRSNAKSQATDAALSRQVACTDGLGLAPGKD